jgi:hypothetical protein
MSIAWMTYAWKSGPPDLVQRYIYLCIADWANDEGHAYPSLPAIAEKTCASLSTVRRAISAMEETGWLEVDRGVGAGNRSQYYLKRVSERHLSESQPDPQSDTEKGVRATPLQKRCQRDTLVKKVSERRKKGVRETTPPHPLIGRTVIEPSVKANTIQPHTAPPGEPAPGPKAKPWDSDGERISPKTIAREVCRRAKWTGEVILDAIAGQVKLEIRGDTTNAKKAEEVAQRMGRAWRIYNSKPDQFLIFAADKFFNQGIWRDEKRWPRRGATPEPNATSAPVGIYNPETTPEPKYTQAEREELVIFAEKSKRNSLTDAEFKRFLQLNDRQPEPKARPN